MNYTNDVKKELCEVKYSSECCKIAVLSGILRSCGFMRMEGGNVGFEITTDNNEVVDFFTRNMNSIFNESLSIGGTFDKLNRKNKTTLVCVNNKSIDIMKELGIVFIDENGDMCLRTGIDEYIVENECCKRAYVRGLFMGCGLVQVPSEKMDTSGYHMTFTFTNPKMAEDFVKLITDITPLKPKMMEHRGNMVVYFSQVDEISDMLAIMGAEKLYVSLSEVVVEKEFNNATNRKVNCDVSNLSKQFDASIKQIQAIEKLEKAGKLKSLSPELVQAANERKKYPKLTLNELAEKLKITKSCLNHRLRKICALAEEYS